MWSRCRKRRARDKDLTFDKLSYLDDKGIVKVGIIKGNNGKRNSLKRVEGKRNASFLC